MRWRAIWITAAAAVLALAAAGWAFVRPPPTPALPDEVSREAILAYARARLTGTEAPAPAFEAPDVRAVIVTAYGAGGKRAAWRDVDGDVTAALAAAAREIAGEAARVRVDLAGAERRVFFRDANTLFGLLDPGIDGLVHRGERFAFAGPSDAVELSLQSWELADRLALQAGFSARDRSPREQMPSLFRYRAASFVESTSGSLVISRGNVLPPWPPTAEELRAAAAAGGRYLAGKQHESGQFIYLYDAANDRPEGGYNLLRHCGTAMSLFQVYGLTKDESVKLAGDRALTWMERTSRFVDPEVPGVIFLKEPPQYGGAIKLGAMGLGVLALLAAEEHGGEFTPERAELARGLGRAILHLQLPSGELASYHAAKGVPVSDRRSIYYPGEATLALVRLYRWDRDPKWLEAAKRSAEFQATRRWTWGGLEMYVPFDAWGAQSLEELWRETKDDRHARWAFTIGDELLRATLPRGANIPPDLVGATMSSRAVRVTPTSSRNEAMVALARLARDFGDEKRARRYREAAIDAAWFSTAQQFRPENSWWVKNPPAAMGGIRESIVDNSVQIDGVQHALTGLIGVAELLETEEAPK